MGICSSAKNSKNNIVNDTPNGEPIQKDLDSNNNHKQKNNNNITNGSLNDSFNDIYLKTTELISRAQGLKQKKVKISAINSTKKDESTAKNKYSHQELLEKANFEEVVEASSKNLLCLKEKFEKYQQDKNKKNVLSDRENKIKELSNTIMLMKL